MPRRSGFLLPWWLGRVWMVQGLEMTGQRGRTCVDPVVAFFGVRLPRSFRTVTQVICRLRLCFLRVSGQGHSCLRLYAGRPALDAASGTRLPLGQHSPTFCSSQVTFHATVGKHLDLSRIFSKRRWHECDLTGCERFHRVHRWSFPRRGGFRLLTSAMKNMNFGRTVAIHCWIEGARERERETMQVRFLHCPSSRDGGQ